MRYMSFKEPLHFLESEADKLALYQEYRKRYPHTEAPTRLPLNFTTGKCKSMFILMSLGVYMEFNFNCVSSLEPMKNGRFQGKNFLRKKGFMLLLNAQNVFTFCQCCFLCSYN